MKVHENLSEQCFQNGYAILEKKNPLITLISLDNSYYKSENIHNLLSLTNSLVSKTYIFTAPSKYTYLAVGYSPEDAVRYTRLQQNKLRNRSKPFVDKVDDPTRFEFVDWPHIESSAAYQKSKKYIYELYEKNLDFHKDARETTLAVLHNKLKVGVELESAFMIGIHYFLEELAFLTIAHEIFGVESIGIVYHRRWPLGENLLNGIYDNIVNKNVGFVVISP